MQAIVDVVHITVFGYIAVIKDLIGCDSPVNYKSFADYASFVTQKIAVEVMIVFVARGVAASDKEFELIVPLVH